MLTDKKFILLEKAEDRDKYFYRKKILKSIALLFDAGVFFLLCFLLIVGLYALLDSKIVYDRAKPSRYIVFKPEPGKETKSFSELKEINPDVFGWLTIYGTDVDYPLVQSDNNRKYVNTDAFGEYSMTGALFLDYRNKNDFSDFNNVIFGHHMEKEVMFGSLDKFADKEFFNSHRYGDIYFDEKKHGLEFFEFFEADAYDKMAFSVAVTDETEKNEYLKYIKALAINKTDTDIGTNDRLVLLSTCSGEKTNGRFLLAAKITDEVFEDIYEKEEEPKEKVEKKKLQSSDTGKIEEYGLVIITGVITFALLITMILLKVKKGKKESGF